MSAGFDPSSVQGALRDAEDVLVSSALCLRSRVHRLRLESGGAELTAWIKRDDELSFGASGSKVRKYASLAPHLLRRGVTHAIVVGAQSSNNVLAAAQYLREEGITPLLVLRRPRDARLPPVVFDLVRELVPSEDVHLLARAGWAARSAAVTARLARSVERAGGVAELVPEGGSHPAALAGAMTLALDLARNEREAGVRFADVFVEAGSGLTALALALRCHVDDPDRRIHVLSTVAAPAELARRYRDLAAAAGVPERCVRNLIVERAPGMRHPQTSPEALAVLRRRSSANGVLFDPYYSGRLLAMLTAQVTAERVDPAQTLMVHTGGGLGILPHLELRRRAADALLSEPIPA
jgi:1-aminocyclopropane-1-carboxylate deaminase/D-cysteine desulfhydrase-like pyridoxal-dependent ACC family enzyme